MRETIVRQDRTDLQPYPASVPESRADKLLRMDSLPAEIAGNFARYVPGLHPEPAVRPEGRSRGGRKKSRTCNRKGRPPCNTHRRWPGERRAESGSYRKTTVAHKVPQRKSEKTPPVARHRRQKRNSRNNADRNRPTGVLHNDAFGAGRRSRAGHRDRIFRRITDAPKSAQKKTAGTQTLPTVPPKKKLRHFSS